MTVSAKNHSNRQEDRSFFRRGRSSDEVARLIKDSKRDLSNQASSGTVQRALSNWPPKSAIDEFLRTTLLWMVILSTLLTGCSLKPPARMDAYLGPPAGIEQGPKAVPLVSPSSPLNVGLLVLNDTTAKDSAPPLSGNALAALTNQVREQILEGVPITVTKVLPDAIITPHQGPQQVVRVAKDQGVGYLLLVIVSSTEVEVPAVLTILNASEGLSGVKVENFALVEIALLDGTTGAVLVQAQGRDWAILKRLSVPMGSNEYPVISRSLEEARIFPREQEMYDELRRFASTEALTQAVLHFQEAWGRVFPI